MEQTVMNAGTPARPQFDAVKFKEMTRSQWESAPPAWDRWGPFIGRWLGPATEAMLDMAALAAGQRVVDVAAGAGEQTLAAARRVGRPGARISAVDSPVRLSSAAECVRFERESFGALHQMMAGLSESERADTWREIEDALRKFERDDGFVGPCEMLVGAAYK